MGSELGTVLRHVRCVLVSRAAREQSDAQLLSCFARDGAEEAFAALVQRHGQHVWRVCRHVLGDHHDAEDAFQATFFVLARHAGSIRKKEALASWLHGAAYRIAMRAKRDAGIRRVHERKGRTMPVEKPLSEESLRETLALLDEEIERLPANQRAVFVLCAVEGKTIAAAARQLAWKEGTVSGTLSRARKQLQRRLSRRSVTLSAAIAAFAVGKQAGAAAVPAALVHETVQAGLLYAAGLPEAASAPAVVLAEATSKAMFLTKVKIATVIVLAGCALSGAGFLGRRALAQPGMQAATDRSSPAVAHGTSPRPTRSTGLIGVVLDDRGRPVAGASVKLWTKVVTPKMSLPVRTATDAHGRFHIEMTPAERDRDPVVIISAPGRPPEWLPVNIEQSCELTLRLPADDVALTGRVLDQEGRPVAGATVHVARIGKTKEPGTLDGWLATTAEVTKRGYYRGYDGLYTCGTRFFDTPSSTTTGSDGRWRLSGFGRDRLLQVTISGLAVEKRQVWVVTRSPSAVQGLPHDPQEGWYAANFEMLLRPSRPIVGTVRDKATGKPLPGMHIRALAVAEPETFTDAKGQYRLEGLPKQDSYTIGAEGLPYFNVTRFLPDSPGFEPIVADVELERGLLVHGRLRDRATGKPVTGTVTYSARAGNPHAKQTDLRSFANDFIGRTDRNGSFSQVVLPGRGWLCASADDGDYLRGVLAGDDHPPLRTVANGQIFIDSFNMIVPINVPEPTGQEPQGDVAGAYDIDLQPAVTRKGEVLGPDGQGMGGVQAAGLEDDGGPSQTLPTAQFTIGGLGSQPRPVVFYCPQKNLGKALRVAGTSTEPVTVRLEAVGGARGRVVDADGRPVASLRVTLQPMSAKYDYQGTFYRPHGAWQMLQQTAKTDEGGRFLVNGLVPEINYAVLVSEAELTPRNMNLLCEVRQLIAKPGEIKDVGDLRTNGD